MLISHALQEQEGQHKTTEGGKHHLKKPVIQSASAPTFDVLGSLLSFCLSPFTLPNPCKGQGWIEIIHGEELGANSGHEEGITLLS